MAIVSASVLATETILFHLLLVVTGYLAATTVIAVALLGVALGGLASFLLGRAPTLLTTTAAAALLFVSIILAYYDVIAAPFFRIPYLLILPFFFASFIVSNLFATGGSVSVLSFANLTGAGAGVLAPLALVPMLKSETTLMLLLFVPVVVVALVALRTRSLVVKLALLACSILVGRGVWLRVAENRRAPMHIAAGVFEGKILAELGDDWVSAAGPRTVNLQWEFLRRVYQRTGDVYVFGSDAYDLERARRLLAAAGLGPAHGLPGLDLLPGSHRLESLRRIDAGLFEGRLSEAFAARYATPMGANWDLRFLRRVYRRAGDGYDLVGDAVDRERAKMLLAELGHVDYVDLAIDLRRHGSLRDRATSYVSNLRILLSSDDLLGRVEYAGDDPEPYLGLNGAYTDAMDGGGGNQWDPRVPRVGFLDSPRVFIVGLSADGIAKSVRLLPGAVVAGVELHPTIFATMSQGPFADIANHPYDGVEAHRAEGRAWLQAESRRWDMITLMNIHPEYGPYSTLAPETLHTVEGIRLLLDRLTDRGMVVFEEIVSTTRAELGLRKQIATALEALRRSGAAEPWKHLYLYRWSFYPGSSIFRTLCLTREPLTPDQARQMGVYVARVAEDYPGAAVTYDPYHDPPTDYEREIRGDRPADLERLPVVLTPYELTHDLLARLDDPRDVEFVLSRYAQEAGVYILRTASLTARDRERLRELCDKAGLPRTLDLSPATDDRPFPFGVYTREPGITENLALVLALSLLLFVPLAALLIRGPGAPARILLPALLYAAASGFGYMLVEITLMQKLQLFIGDPTRSVVVALGGILVFSGLGSLATRFLPRRIAALFCLGIPALLFLYRGSLDTWFAALSGTGDLARLWTAGGLILPLALLMGMPFPLVMETVRRRVSGEFVALLYGVNGGCSTIAAAVALSVNVRQGFGSSFTLGAVLYAAALIPVLLLTLVGRARVPE